MKQQATPDGEPASSTAVKGNADDGQQGGEAQAAKAAQKELLVPRHGKQIPMSQERVIALASKGLDYETRSGELKKDEQFYKEYSQFRQQLEGDPELKRAVQHAMKNPQAVLRASTIQPAANGASNDDDEAEVTTPSISRREFDELRSEFQGTKRVAEKVDRETADERFERLMDREVASYGLKGKAAELAKQHARSEVERGSKDAPASIIGTYVADLRDLLKEDQESRLEAAAKAKEFKTSPAARRMPMASEIPKMNKNSFRDGTMQKALAHAAKHFFGD